MILDAVISDSDSVELCLRGHARGPVVIGARGPRAAALAGELAALILGELRLDASAVELVGPRGGTRHHRAPVAG